jgi:hypothetical protein
VTEPRLERAASRLGGYLIGRASRGLPGDARDERYREWVAELPAIVQDPEIGSALRRAARALTYAAGIYRSARRLRRAAGAGRNPRPVHAQVGSGWASRSARRRLTTPVLADGVRPAIAALLTLLSMAAVLASYPPSRSWPYLIVSASVAVDALALVALVRFGRWVRRGSRGAPPS